jgi:hypothetical protein
VQLASAWAKVFRLALPNELFGEENGTEAVASSDVEPLAA